MGGRGARVNKKKKLKEGQANEYGNYFLEKVDGTRAYFGEGMTSKTKVGKFEKDFLYKGFDYSESSNRYLAITSVSKDNDKIAIRVSSDAVFNTKYGKGYRLNATEGIWLKDWQVKESYRGGTVLFLDRKYYKVSKFNENSNFSYEKAPSFDKMLKIARTQKFQYVERSY
ncbi:TPA: hypothetical protein TY768_000918 [Streptococcus suis]|nr:hypothetical protein [Streptococcus suis]